MILTITTNDVIGKGITHNKNERWVSKEDLKDIVRGVIICG